MLTVLTEISLESDTINVTVFNFYGYDSNLELHPVSSVFVYFTRDPCLMLPMNCFSELPLVALLLLQADLFGLGLLDVLGSEVISV